MTRKLQILRGTTAQNNAYTGAVGELTMDTDRNEVRIHDGQTVGGIKIGKRNMPLLTPMWFDHIANDVSWLRADTFSWQSGDVYKAVYEHLINDLETKQTHQVQMYGWGQGVLTTSQNPNVGDSVYAVYSDNTPTKVGVILSYDSSSNKITYTDSGVEYTASPRESYNPILAIDEYEERIDGTTVVYYLAEDGHKICLPDQESNLVALYEKTGVAWYYILDTTNKQFKLPRTKWGFTGLRDGVGGYVAPGLPNIKDSLQLIGGGGCGFYGDTTGALYASGSATSQLAQQSGGQTHTKINIDASVASAIYGASDTVQPPATQMYLYFWVGAFDQTATEQTAGLNAELFNNKADIDLGNIPANYDYVIESQLPTANNGYTWYRKYKSGWVEQGGYKEISTGGSATISLPVAMVDTNYSAQMTPAANTSGGSPRIAIIKSNLTTTTVILNWYSYPDGTAKAYWQVSGMSA